MAVHTSTTSVKKYTVCFFAKISKINVYDTKQVKYINLMTNITYFIFHIIFTTTAKKRP